MTLPLFKGLDHSANQIAIDWLRAIGVSNGMTEEQGNTLLTSMINRANLVNLLTAFMHKHIKTMKSAEKKALKEKRNTLNEDYLTSVSTLYKRISEGIGN